MKEKKVLHKKQLKRRKDFMAKIYFSLFLNSSEVNVEEKKSPKFSPLYQD